MGSMLPGWWRRSDPPPQWDADKPYESYATGAYCFVLRATPELLVLLSRVREVRAIEDRDDMAIVTLRKDAATDADTALNIWRGLCSYLEQRVNPVFTDDVWLCAINALDLESVEVTPGEWEGDDRDYRAPY